MIETLASRWVSFSQDTTLRKWRHSILAWAAGVLALVIIHFPVLSVMMDVWINDKAYNHGFFVLPISVGLFWFSRHRLASINPTIGWMALPIIAAASLLIRVGDAGSLSLVSHFGFATILAAIFPLCFGWQAFRALKFPVLFLYFLVPFGTELTPQLQEITALISIEMIRAVGIASYREGILVELSSGLFEVAEACAGVRFLVANIMIAALFSYLSFDKRWKIILFMFLALTIPILANAVRAFGVMYIAHISNLEYATGYDHLVYGWFFFSVVMVILLAIGSLFADRHVGDPLPHFVPKISAMPQPGLAQMIARNHVVSLLLAVMLIALAPLLEVFSQQPQHRAPPVQVTTQLVSDDWQLVEIEPDADNYWQPRFAAADWSVRLDFVKDGKKVHLYAVWYAYQDSGKELIDYNNRFDDGKKWVRGSVGSVQLSTGENSLPGNARMDLLNGVRKRGNSKLGKFERMAVVSWYWVNKNFTGSNLSAKAHQILSKLMSREPSAGIFALAADYKNNEQEALERIEEFIGDMQQPAETVFSSP